MGIKLFRGKKFRVSNLLSMFSLLAILQSDLLDCITLLLISVLLGHILLHFLKYGTNYPGPFLFPFVGCFPQILFHRKNLYDWSVSILKRCDRLTYSSFSLGFRGVVTANPENLEHILKTNFTNYPKGPIFQDNFRDLLGHGIFNSDGEVWQMQRKKASVQFSASSLRDLIVNSVKRELCERLIPTLEKASRERTPVDLQDVLLRYTFDNICQIGFGVDPGCLAPDFPVVPFAQAFDEATKATLLRSFWPPKTWRILKWLNWGSEAKLKNALKVIDEFSEEVIKKRENELQSLSGGKFQELLGGTKGPFSDILSRMMLLELEDEGQIFRKSFLRDACTNFILAGRDTSAVALTWLFWMLTWHPQVESEILREIHQILSKRTKERRNEGSFSYEELKEMNFLQASISETLRLYPSVPVDSKYVLKEDILPDGTRVLPGWRVSYMIYAMGRMEGIWGEDASRFNPHRWILEDGSCRVESSFKFPAFNGGPRLCLGREMAFLQMKSVAATILRYFEVKLFPGKEVVPSLSLTLFIKDGLSVIIQPRQNLTR